MPTHGLQPVAPDRSQSQQVCELSPAHRKSANGRILQLDSRKRRTAVGEDARTPCGGCQRQGEEKKRGTGEERGWGRRDAHSRLFEQHGNLVVGLFLTLSFSYTLQRKFPPDEEQSDAIACRVSTRSPSLKQSRHSTRRFTSASISVISSKETKPLESIACNGRRINLKVKALIFTMRVLGSAGHGIHPQKEG